MAEENLLIVPCYIKKYGPHYVAEFDEINDFQLTARSLSLLLYLLKNFITIYLYYEPDKRRNMLIREFKTDNNSFMTLIQCDFNHFENLAKQHPQISKNNYFEYFNQYSDSSLINSIVKKYGNVKVSQTENNNKSLNNKNINPQADVFLEDLNVTDKKIKEKRPTTL